MRIFTDKEKIAFTNAFRIFLREIDGQKRDFDELKEYFDKAMGYGILIDELFNKKNYLRAVEIMPNGANPESYIDILYNREIEVKEIKEEPEWCNDIDYMNLLVSCFKEFFANINEGRAGIWNSMSVRLALEKTIKLYSLQSMMSEELINEVKNNINYQITIYNYLDYILKESKSLNIKDELTKEQQEFLKFKNNDYYNILNNINNDPYQEQSFQPETDEIDNTDEIEGEEAVETIYEENNTENEELTKDIEEVANEEIKETTDKTEKYYEWLTDIIDKQEENTEEELLESQKVKEELEKEIQDTESVDDCPTETEENDLVVGTMSQNDIIEDSDIYALDEIPEHIVIEEDTNSFVKIVDPRVCKKNAIIEAINNLSIEEINEISNIVPDIRTLDDLIEKLTDGQIDKTQENPQAKQIHQYLNNLIIDQFVATVNMQGYVMNEEIANQHDLISENWDYRDPKTRKLYKIKQLILTYGEQDSDLQQALKEIEELYL